MATTTPTAGCDTQDMVVVHRMFRRLFRDGPALIRGVARGDADHRRFVVDHLLQLCGALHNHHRTEDQHLWDRLAAKAPACSIHVGLMRQQHAEMAVRLDTAEAALIAWRADGAAEQAAACEDAMVGVVDSLEEHLGDEERRILPEAARALTQKEWDVLSKVARSEKVEVPDFVQPVSPWVQLGLMLDGLDEHEAREARRVLPAPAIVLYRLVGRRRFAAYRRRLWGTAA
jgi:hemerythrin-like domain-containing protein